MSIIYYIKNLLNKIKDKRNGNIILTSSQDLYSDFITKPEITSIIDNMPTNLSQMEKAYYIYLKLGKFLSESPTFVFSDLFR